MSKLQFVVVKIMNLMEEGGSETLKYFVSEIFVELEQWGHFVETRCYGSI